MRESQSNRPDTEQRQVYYIETTVSVKGKYNLQQKQYRPTRQQCAIPKAEHTRRGEKFKTTLKNTFISIYSKSLSPRYL